MGGSQHAEARAKQESSKAKEEKRKEKKSATSQPLAMNFMPQSAADGACSLMEASFGASANSGDFYMPRDMVKGTPVGMPVKCMTAGKPSPVSESMAKRFKNEELTMNEANHKILWIESEK